MCLFLQQNQKPVLESHRFFRRKVTIFIGSETKTHILPTKINETNSLRSAHLTIIILLEYKNHPTTTTSFHSNNNKQISLSAVEASASQVVHSSLAMSESALPVIKQIHRKPIAAEQFVESVKEVPQERLPKPTEVPCGAHTCSRRAFSVDASLCSTSKLQ